MLYDSEREQRRLSGVLVRFCLQPRPTRADCIGFGIKVLSKYPTKMLNDSSVKLETDQALTGVALFTEA